MAEALAGLEGLRAARATRTAPTDAAATGRRDRGGSMAAVPWDRLAHRCAMDRHRPAATAL